ncbi:hypothetical protein P8452_32073 [Trifolium repens]|nr:hypothetical protein P8452_32073 [Trifolium repens]
MNRVNKMRSGDILGKFRVQNKGKVDEVINVEGSASKEYTQVRHDQERLEADKLLEIELNKNLGDTEACSNSPHNSENVEDVVPVHIITPGVDTQDNSSSIGSDFVDNTQIGQDPKHISSKSDGAEQIPLLVQNDIQFLKESWANLAILRPQALKGIEGTRRKWRMLVKPVFGNSPSHKRIFQKSCLDRAVFKRFPQF